jgi:hypothetical protein
MAEKHVLGHIDCPTCGTAHGMRVTLDKNGEPFAFCEANCNQQMRIGGNARRVAAFVARYPWAAGKAEAPAPATVPVTAPATAPEPKAKPKTKAFANPFDYLLNPS